MSAQEAKGKVMFYIAMSWGTKGRYGEAIYWESTKKTQAREKILVKVAKKLEDCQAGTIPLCASCNSFDVYKKSVDLELAESGGLTWTLLREEELGDEAQMNAVPAFLEEHAKEFSDFDNMIFTKAIKKQS
jgi:hypothetical protein